MWENQLFDELLRMQRDLDRMFGGARQLTYSGQSGQPSVVRRPVCDLCETEKSVIASFELPGVEKKDIELEVNDASIRVSVGKKDKKKSKDEIVWQGHSFYLELALPRRVDSSQARARFKNGVLRVELPKIQKEAKKRLQIE